MSQTPEFDLEKAHHYFAADCFNRTWDYIDKPSRTAEEGQAMLLLSLASLWHWTQRADAMPSNLSVGYWQVARVYALLGQADNARQYGLLSIKESQKDGVLPFYLGYSYEALARAESVAGDKEKVQSYLGLARQACEKVTDPEEKKLILDDLATIG
jgi:hypothetical protein